MILTLIPGCNYCAICSVYAARLYRCIRNRKISIFYATRHLRSELRKSHTGLKSTESTLRCCCCCHRRNVVSCLNDLAVFEMAAFSVTAIYCCFVKIVLLMYFKHRIKSRVEITLEVWKNGSASILTMKIGS